MAYKKDQGRMARMAAFWILAILWFYGTTSLNEELASFERLGTAVGGIRIPVVGMDLTPALLISAVILAIGSTCSSRATGRSSTSVRRT